MSAQPLTSLAWVTASEQPRLRFRNRDCAVCRAPSDDAVALPYGRGIWSIVRCRHCAFVYVPLAPETVEFEENLDWDKRHTEEHDLRRRVFPIQQRLDAAFRWRLQLLPRTQPVDILNRHGPASGIVVDLGCGAGEALGQVDRRFTIHGVEISRKLAARADRIAAKRGGQAVQMSALDGLRGFASGSVAGVLARSYLEHDADAATVFAELSRVLQPGGICIAKVPNYGSINRRVMGRSWCGFRLPDHVNYFRRRDMARLAQANRLQAAFPFLLSLPTDDNFIAILSKRNG